MAPSLIAYHGLNFADAEGPARAGIRERAQLEERSLRGLLQRAHTLGVTIAIENLAPVHPVPPRLCRRSSRRWRPTSCSSTCTTNLGVRRHDLDELTGAALRALASEPQRAAA